ncbi:hypothetical protein [Streptomyces malaysiensis]|nr:hypothetical protein [Streptomyces sp. SPMA113]
MAETDKQQPRRRAVARTALFAFVRGGAMAAGGCAVSGLAWLLNHFVG